jgi:hypothetical protein
MNRRCAGGVALVALLTSTVACGTSASKPAGSAAADRLQTEYDTAGRLTRLAYDRDGDGKVDAWGYMDGARVVRVEVDENADGKPDSWEYHSPTAAPGTTPGGIDKTIERVERATQFDGRVTRREYFDAGVLTRVEEDTDGDGKNDKWETYVNGALATMALDTQGRGTPDRRMIYGADGSLIRIEVDTEGAGVFRPVPQAQR